MSMNNGKKKSISSCQRRSAVSFELNGSLDVDHILEDSPWKDIEKFEKDDAGCLQNVLNTFSTKFSQEKLYPPESMLKQNNSKQAKKASSRNVSPNPKSSNVDEKNAAIFSESSSKHEVAPELEIKVEKHKEVLHTSTPNGSSASQKKPVEKKVTNKKVVSKKLIKTSNAAQDTSQKQKTSEKENIKTTYGKSSTIQNDKIKITQQDSPEHDNKRLKEKNSNSNQCLVQIGLNRIDIDKVESLKKEVRELKRQRRKNSKKAVKKLEELSTQMMDLTKKMLRVLKNNLDTSSSDSSDESSSVDYTTSSSAGTSDSELRTYAALSTSTSNSDLQTSYTTTDSSTELSDRERKKKTRKRNISKCNTDKSSKRSKK